MNSSHKSFDARIWALVAITGAIAIAMLILGVRPTLDMRLYYSGDEARTFIADLSQPAKNAYFINELFDLGFIFSYSGLFYFIAKKLFPQKRFLAALALLPGFFDFIETSFIIYALKAAGPQNFFDWLGAATFLKWASSGAVIAILAWGFFRKSHFHNR